MLGPGLDPDPPIPETRGVGEDHLGAKWSLAKTLEPPGLARLEMALRQIAQCLLMAMGLLVDVLILFPRKAFVLISPRVTVP